MGIIAIYYDKDNVRRASFWEKILKIQFQSY